jgi:hypothetical protein
MSLWRAMMKMIVFLGSVNISWGLLPGLCFSGVKDQLGAWASQASSLSNPEI